MNNLKMFLDFTKFTVLLPLCAIIFGCWQARASTSAPPFEIAPPEIARPKIARSESVPPESAQPNSAGSGVGGGVGGGIGSAAGSDILGVWYTENREGGVEIYPCGPEVCGRFYWLNENGADPKIDIHNPDPAKRQHSLCHLQFMTGFTPVMNERYTGGSIYNPRDGHSVSAEMKMLNHNTIAVRGYLLMPLLGANQTWTRAVNLTECRES
jgi:uncharacterized protein (DUF2147 family)